MGARRTISFLAVVLLATLAVSGCGGDSGDSGGGLSVVATTTQVGDFARKVAGDDADVEQILAPNTDPHDYEPRPSDIVAVAEADVVLASGDGLDGWIEEVVSDSGSDATVVDLGAVAPERIAGEESGEEASEFDPHWWHDPRNAEAAVEEIERALSAEDPGHSAAYARNADAYAQKIRELDSGIAECIGSVPADQRKLVTDHDAFNYFAERYGIEVVGALIPSQTTQGQASAKDLSELADTIERENVRAVFPESSVNASLAEAIARETGASADYELYGDTLGEEGSVADTYLGMEAANAEAMVRGFTGGAKACVISR